MDYFPNWLLLRKQSWRRLGIVLRKLHTNVHYKAQVFYASGDERNPTYTKAETFFVQTSTFK